MDGTQWEVEIRQGDRRISASGSNRYPAYEDESVQVGRQTQRFKHFAIAGRELLGGRPFGNVDGKPQSIASDELQAIERHSHAVIRERAGDLVDRHEVELPDLSTLSDSEGQEAWFSVPGMYGGSSYRLDAEGANVRLIVESRCRIVGGSGQHHEITADGARLVDQGFV